MREVHVPEGVWRFKSSRPHHFKPILYSSENPEYDARLCFTSRFGNRSRGIDFAFPAPPKIKPMTVS